MFPKAERATSLNNTTKDAMITAKSFREFYSAYPQDHSRSLNRDFIFLEHSWYFSCLFTP